MDAFADNYRFLARYNQWFNARLFDACEGLTDAQRKQDRGAFFGSIHRTLNHLVVGDQVWLKRLWQCGQDHGWQAAALGSELLDLPPGAGLDSILFDDWLALRARRTQLDAAVVQWATDMPDGYCTIHHALRQLQGGAARAPCLAGHDPLLQPPGPPPRAGDGPADAGGC
jgi:hypothetical protein